MTTTTTTKRTEAKAQRLVDQAVRLYGMTRRAAREWAFTQIVTDFETAARNASLVQTYWSVSLQANVTEPSR